MRIFITGATGLIGRRLVIDRLERGDHVVLLSRDAGRASRMFAAGANRNITVVQGDPSTSGQWQNALAGCDAVVNLAGAGVADRRWSKAYKKTMIISRVEGTRQIVETIERTPFAHRPRVLVNGSAMGYYGHAGDRELTEQSQAGTDFLAQLTVEWEAQAQQAEQLQPPVRVVMLRTAVVLDDRGGALDQMLMPFRFFAGGPLGWGKQWLSWIHWRDLIGLINLALEEDELHGPLNGSSPQPQRQKDFAKALGRAIGKPSWLPTPKFALRLALGEVANAIFNSARVMPAVALRYGYRFLYPDLDAALANLLETDEEDDEASAVGEIRVIAPPDPNAGPAVLHGEEAIAPSSIPQTAARKKLQMPVVPIKLLAVDVDGTLLNSDGSIAQGVIQACRAAERAGCLVVLATARAPRSVRTILQTLDITGPSINYNGALIWNPFESKPNYHEALSAELARAIVDDVLAADAEIIIGIEAINRWCVNRIDPQFIGTTDPENAPDAVGELDAWLTQPVTKLNLMGPAERLTPIRDLVRERYWQARRVAVFLTDPRLVQIAAPLVDKGIALQRIARRLGLAREQVMAIGDASNDMGMIEWAGFGAAMGNAYPAVKQLADVVVPSNDEQGVAKAIQRYVLAKR